MFKDEKIWRILTNFWTYLFMIFLCANFFLDNSYEFLIAPMSVIYVSILGLYVSTKEFDRWYEMHKNERHPGELFVVFWTVIIFGLMLASVVSGGEQKLSTEAVATYIMVLSVFALTQKSKALYRKKKERLKK
jgi:hypothetical protein